MTPVDQAFLAARAGDPRAESTWMGLVELSIWKSLARFARYVDVEVVVQETLLRMLVLIRDPDRELTGENASLRFAIRVASNVAREEARRLRHDLPLGDPDALDRDPALQVEPEPPSDHRLRRAIERCLEAIPGRSRQALLARLYDGHHLSDLDLANSLRMKKNTFLQNIVRARNFLEHCLERRGLPLSEILR